MGALVDDLVAEQKQELARSEPSRWVTVDRQPLPHNVGDRGLIGHAFRSLLANAFKFTRKVPDAHITVRAEVTPSEITYVVADNGAGFEMAYASRLFTAFQRLHGPDEFEGSGVGLSLAARVVRRHGGRIGAEGSIGQGATFRVTLPR
jgi:two-component system sensor kinase